jgi:ABC-type oligopeptide transport system substrate-binding subunit
MQIMNKHLKRCLIMMASSLLLAGCCTGHHQATKWEYKTVGNPTDATLNELAEQGWSVVTVASGVWQGGMEIQKDYLLKRPKR